uniref:Succinate-semialdehyde dehydrogenase, mitochondrial n=1 Tax=Macrostomum lignano TaxID=282301 RepID=A0A1I8HHA9_9PLAT
MRLLLSSQIARTLLSLSSRAMSSSSYKSLLREKAFVNGQWVNAANRESFPVYNPANGELVCKVPDMGAADATAAIAHAQVAFEAWRGKTPSQRAALLHSWERLIQDRCEDLAALMTLENGKPLAESRGEVAYGASFIRWFAEEGIRVTGQTLQGPTPDKRIFTLKQPQGVCGMITPWNFPAAMITRKAGAALAAGCTVVIKPAEDTPLTALALCQLAADALLPPGALNVVTCSRSRAAEVGRVLTTDPAVKHVSFTGSTDTGKLLLAQASSTVKRVTMELGGNAPFIVFDSADVDKAVAGLIQAKFRNTGQTCVCPNRIFLQRRVSQKFLAKLCERVAEMKVGDGFEVCWLLGCWGIASSAHGLMRKQFSTSNQGEFDKGSEGELHKRSEGGIAQAAGTQLGPLINAAAESKLERLLADAKQRGGRVLAGGQSVKVGSGAGHFFQPTVVSGLGRDSACFREEIFGPLVAAFEFDSEADVVELANDCRVGLAGYFYSADVGQCWRVAEQLNVGMVGVNESMVSSCIAPFGGWNESGLGSESGVGYGIEEYLNLKTVVLNLA